MIIRLADEGDIPELLEMFEQFDKFANDGWRVYFGEHTRELLLKYLASPEFKWWVAESDSEIVGVIAGLMSKHFMNPNITVFNEIVWWVRPDRRGSTAGARLFDVFNRFAEEHADMCVTTLESKSPVNDEFLYRKGFELKEKNYLKRF